MELLVGIHLSRISADDTMIIKIKSSHTGRNPTNGKGTWKRKRHFWFAPQFVECPKLTGEVFKLLNIHQTVLLLRDAQKLFPMLTYIFILIFFFLFNTGHMLAQLIC